ncbi:uncharacterized protein LOC115075967 [Rhinatrema bivittatum]|uniref:uncharacterized protein LOC115075967 n=1 Tax=Rhinatrema bivittatum TaxID=194408 RepID=UPI00112BED6C|nr:uncharacterized protein LOC115075967 [Rhinatrema bivittatum]
MGNLDFRPGRDCRGIFQFWASRGVEYLYHLFDSGTHELLDFQTLARAHQLSPKHYFGYLQARHYTQTFCWSTDDVAAESLFATTVTNSIKCWKRLCMDYKRPDHLAVLASRWTSVLHNPVTSEQLKYGFQTLHNQNPDLGLRELQYHILHLSYYDDVKRFRMGLTDTPLCIKCGGEEGGLIHRLLLCPTVAPFWTRVLQTIFQCTGLHGRCEGRALLSHPLYAVNPCPLGKARFARLAMLLACRTILSVWVEPQGKPTDEAWFARMTFELQMERLDCISGHRTRDQTYEDCWQAFFQGLPGGAQANLLISGYSNDWT